ncbi:MAG: hypothetical protein ABI743_03145, partial [bacterium]
MSGNIPPSYARLGWILALLVSCTTLATLPAQAQDSGQVTLRQEQLGDVHEANTTVADTNVEEALDAPLGVVQEIVINGLPSVDIDVVKAQLTVAEGDTLTEYHLRLSAKRLYQLGIFYKVLINYEPIVPEAIETPAPMPETVAPLEGAPATEEGAAATADAVADPSATASEAPPETTPPPTIDPNRPLRLMVDVFEERTWYLYPYGISETPFLIGATIGDRDFLQSGKHLNGTVIAVDDLAYYSVGYEDPQFLGGHHHAYFNATLSDSAISIRDEVNTSTGESYFISRDSASFNYATTHD